MVLLPSAPGAVPPRAAVLPLPEIRKFVCVRLALLPPEFATMMALVPVPLSETALLVIAMTCAGSFGMPAVAPGPLPFALPMET